MKKALVLAGVYLLFIGYFNPNKVQAGACTQTDGNYSENACQQAESNSKNITCPSGSYPYYSCNGVVGGTWSYCWGCHVVGGSDVCPAECRAGTSCPQNGYSDAAGCPGTGPHSGCRIDQACCRPNSCDPSSGTGPGQCPLGQTLIPDPAYAPSYHSCGTGGCFAPNMGDGIECGVTKKGQTKWGCNRYICCTPTSVSTPVLTSPANGATIVTTSATLYWNPVNFGDQCGKPTRYEVFLGTSESSLNKIATITNGATSYPVSGLTNGTTYYWQIFAGTDISGKYSAVWNFKVAAENMVKGNVYDDVGANCTTTNKITSLSSLTATWSNGTNTFTANASTGSYSINAGAVSSVGSVNLNGLGTYMLTPTSITNCAGNSNPRSGVTPGAASATNVNFYLTQTRKAWWKAVGAGIYAGATSGESVKSLLPVSAQRLIEDNGINDAGALVKVSPTSSNLGFGTQISDNKWTANSVYKGEVMNYAYFKDHMNIGSSRPKDNIADEIQINDVNKEIYYIVPPTGTATISTDWNLNAVGEKHVIFVNGNLRINANVRVPVGKFLAFVVSGNVYVSPSASSRIIEGLYVMNGTFNSETTGTTDGQLAVYGSVVTWSGVSLARDLGSTANLTTPAEKFLYRPDLLVNMPLDMKSFVLNWQEVAPGTFSH